MSSDASSPRTPCFTAPSRRCTRKNCSSRSSRRKLHSSDAWPPASTSIWFSSISLPRLRGRVGWGSQRPASRSTTRASPSISSSPTDGADPPERPPAWERRTPLPISRLKVIDHAERSAFPTSALEDDSGIVQNVYCGLLCLGLGPVGGGRRDNGPNRVGWLAQGRGQAGVELGK